MCLSASVSKAWVAKAPHVPISPGRPSQASCPRVGACAAAFETLQYTVLSVCLNFLLLQKESGEEVEVEEFYVKYKNL